MVNHIGLMMIHHQIWRVSPIQGRQVDFHRVVIPINPPFLDIRRPAPQFRRCGVEPMLKLDPAAAAQYSEPKRRGWDGWDGNLWNFG